MNPELKVTLDIAQLIMLGGLVWALSRMSSAVDSLKEVTKKLTAGLEHVVTEFAQMTTRVSVLEVLTDRSGRRRHTDPE